MVKNWTAMRSGGAMVVRGIGEDGVTVKLTKVTVIKGGYPCCTAHTADGKVFDLANPAD